MKIVFVHIVEVLETGNNTSAMLRSTPVLHLTCSCFCLLQQTLKATKNQCYVYKEQEVVPQIEKLQTVLANMTDPLINPRHKSKAYTECFTSFHKTHQILLSL